MKLWINMFWIFFKIGAFTLGGGYAMIPLIEREVVGKKQWIKKEEIVDIFAVSQSIPGAIAINSSTFIGYRIGGYWGAIWATLGVILPSFIIITVIATIFMQFQNLPVVKAAFIGINATVVALIIIAAVQISKDAIKDKIGIVIMIAALFLLVVCKINAILIIILGAFAGLGLSYFLRKGEKEGKE